MNPIAQSLIWWLLASLCVSPVHAEPSTLPAPEGPVLLEISGDIRYTNAGDEARFDREMLRALPEQVVETDTPWTDRSRRFSGPLMRDLLARVGARGDWLKVEALNNYSGEIPISDVEEYGVILAMSRDGEPLAVRDFGPLFVLYPFDEHSELNTETIRFRSVWQVAEIHVY
ncbi:molybdopterin-dependent oxidoreductase [Halomonas sp. YLGW01]|uniref:molybdopterin-dependent oxidoreductase n=1 Tax=Halomonas sp. YLGW01 TaxID=2773308 RepID=UPI0017831877|nr:molybdopterin-dependent oxidoreductase [Halomonas sp. YLGW01]